MQALSSEDLMLEQFQALHTLPSNCVCVITSHYLYNLLSFKASDKVPAPLPIDIRFPKHHFMVCNTYHHNTALIYLHTRSWHTNDLLHRKPTQKLQYQSHFLCPHFHLTQQHDWQVLSQRVRLQALSLARKTCSDSVPTRTPKICCGGLLCFRLWFCQN
jgi:hypothetical protein